MLLIGTRNLLTQTIPAGNPIAVGDVYRKYCKKNSCGIRAFDTNPNSLVLRHSGMYKVHATITFTGVAAGDVTLQLAQNNILIPGALATETVTTADTEVITTSIDFFVLVGNACMLDSVSNIEQNISVVNAGETDITVTNFVLNITKVV